MIDRITAAVLLIVFIPLFIIIYVTLLITQGAPVFYIKKRSGLYKIPFNLYKFRSLKPVVFEDLSMENRHYTFFGKMMRLSGLDELPQLLNILKGEMSFVGPRPMPTEYDTMYNPTHLRRFEVLPGITGWAQIHGRNRTSWMQRFDLDVAYTNHISFALDLKIVGRTFVETAKSIFSKDKTHIEMPVFNGSNLN